MTVYCEFCDAELIGARRFCVKCGREQKREIKRTTVDRTMEKPKKEEPRGEACFRCGEDTERGCYFCGKPICQNHSHKMQANVLPDIEFRTALSLGDRKRINQGWRGFIIDACSRCSGMNNGKALTEDEKIEIRTVDICSWFELKPKEHKFDVGHYWNEDRR